MLLFLLFFFSQHVVKESRRWFSRMRMEGPLFRFILSWYLRLALYQKWFIFLIFLGIITSAVFLSKVCLLIRPSEELSCHPIFLFFSTITSILCCWWLHSCSCRSFQVLPWKILKIKPAGTFLKVCIVNMQVLIHIYFYKDVQTQ